MSCEICQKNKAVLLKYNKKICKYCFTEEFENDVHLAIKDIFKKNMKVGVGMSGGKDSTVLAWVLNKLNIKYNYGIEILLLTVDEGIKGYRDHSIEAVYYNAEILKLRLTIVSYKDIFGLSMDEIVQRIGTKNNCTYCGVFRRQSLELAAHKMKVDIIATGHNADDIAETVLLNLIRGDISRFRRCSSILTAGQLDSEEKLISLPRFKPFKFIYQKEIVLYAHYNKLRYFSTECSYFKNADARGNSRTLIKNLESLEPKIIINIIKSCEKFSIEELYEKVNIKVNPCKNCQNPCSSLDEVCYACKLIITLQKIKPF